MMDRAGGRCSNLPGGLTEGTKGSWGRAVDTCVWIGSVTPSVALAPSPPWGAPRWRCHMLGGYVPRTWVWPHSPWHSVKPGLGWKPSSQSQRKLPTVLTQRPLAQRLGWAWHSSSSEAGGMRQAGERAEAGVPRAGLHLQGQSLPTHTLRL